VGDDPFDGLLSVRAVALRLKCSEKTVWRRVRDGNLPRVKVLGRTYVPAVDVDAYIATMRNDIAPRTTTRRAK